MRMVSFQRVWDIGGNIVLRGTCPRCGRDDVWFELGWKWISLFGLVWLFPLGTALRCPNCARTAPGSGKLARDRIGDVMQSCDQLGYSKYTWRAKLVNTQTGRMVILLGLSVGLYLLGDRVFPDNGWAPLVAALVGWYIGIGIVSEWTESHPKRGRRR